MTTYDSKLEKGRIYQDFLMLALAWGYGIYLRFFSSQKCQRMFPDTTCGWEVKRDGHFRETNNLYIETHESTSSSKRLVPSGILRNDICTHWLIGDEETVYLLPKPTLKELYESQKYHQVTQETSSGMLLPVSVAEEIAEEKFQFPPQLRWTIWEGGTVGKLPEQTTPGELHRAVSPDREGSAESRTDTRCGERQGEASQAA